MKVLVITPEVIEVDRLRAALGGEEGVEEAEVMVVSPALQESKLRFWIGDADEAIARARAVADESARKLDEGGVQASADTGDSDPLIAIQDALVGFPADRVVVFVHADEERRYLEDDLGRRAQERFGVPVAEHVLDG